MPDIYLAIDILVVVTLFGLGLTVLIKNSGLVLNRLFALFALSIGVWIVANYVSNDIDQSPETAVIANYFVFFFSYAAVYFLLWFVIKLAHDRTAQRVYRIAQPILALLAIGTATPLLVDGVSVQGSVYAVHFGPWLPLYAIPLVGMIASVLYVLARGIRRATGSRRARLAVINTSFLIALPMVLATNFVLPAASGWFGLTNIGILPMLILVYGLYYGAIKHGLFNLKPIIVRSLAYVLSTGFLAVIYAMALYAIGLLTGYVYEQQLQDVLNVLVIVLLISVYPSLSARFRRVTNRIFYRDLYDTQQFLDEFNKVLVSTFSLELMLERAAKVIEANLKPTSILFTINQTSTFEARTIRGAGKLNLDSKAMTVINDETTASGKKIIPVDTLGSKFANLNAVMQRNDLAVIAKLSADMNSKGLGYLIIGTKKSGNEYSRQDLAVIDIVVNSFVLAIQNVLRFEEIENFNRTLQANVNKATRQYRATNEKLKALDETKDDFISMASHQLRTPLTSVKGYISMVLEEDAGKLNARQREMLGQAYISSQRMVYLIADLLNVSRLKNGKFVIMPAIVNLAEVVGEELNQLQETAASRGLTLSYTPPKDFPQTELDETKTRQVIMNFVDNAIYYTPTGGHIEVSLAEKPHGIELRVKDSGIGVPKREQPHLFTKFYRADNARKARPDGTGLGLFMAKKVIIAQGGAIIFETREGKGSTFGFMLPKKLPKQKSPSP